MAVLHRAGRGVTLWLSLLLAATSVLALPGPAFAQSTKGVVAGSEMAGFGRVVFSFEQVIGAKVRSINSVLVLDFDENVAIDIEKLSSQLPNYISVARLDPNGKSLRIGLNGRFKADLKPAGEKVYLDILPDRWQGLPPSLPAEVVQDLVRRARIAEDQIRRIDRERDRNTSRDLDLRIGTAPLFKRAMFVMPRAVHVDLDQAGNEHVLMFDAALRITPEKIRSELAGLITDVEVDPAANTLKIVLKAADGIQVRGFREDDTYNLDFSRENGAPIDAVIGPADAARKVQSVAPPPAAKSEAAKQQSTKVDNTAPAAAPAAAPQAMPPRVIPIDKRAQAEPLAKEPPAKEKAASAPAGIRLPIETSLVPGKDPDSFAFNVSHLNKTPIAILQRKNALVVVLETKEMLSAPVVPPVLKAQIEHAGMSRKANATTFVIATKSPGLFWLTRDDSGIKLHLGSDEAKPVGARSIPITRSFDQRGRPNLEAKLEQPGELHWVDDPLTGQKLAIVPVIDAEQANQKPQNFAEFTLEPTLAGFAVLPFDEAVTVARKDSSVFVGHEIGLNLSNLPAATPDAVVSNRNLLIDTASWDAETRGAIRLREGALLRAAAESPRVNRTDARLRLARFYLANGFEPEAKGVLDVLTEDDQEAAGSKSVLFHRALANALMGRTVDATKLLAEPALAMDPEQRLLSGLVDTKSMRYPQAVEHFKAAQADIGRYPERLQAIFRRAAIESAIEASDPAFAREQLLAYEQLPGDVKNPHLQQLLAARLAEMQGRFTDAFAAYELAIQSNDRRIEAEARFGRATAGLADGKLALEAAKAEFETLTAIWRRSEVELKSLAKLGEIYAEEGRWREAFLASQRATAIMVDHPITRRMEEVMGRRFENLFLDQEGDKISKVEALAIYQEFKTLMPAGRRGDEIARRLADRLHDLDLVHEAANILEHQVNHRLDGVARATVATRLAVMYLQGREPVKALNALRNSRLASMPRDLRRARTLLESRALGDLFRTELAVEVIANETGDDADRLRADILWKGKRWREAGEAYERVLANSWQTPEALTEMQRLDVMRAGLAYVLGEESLSLDRLRGKFMPKMAKTEDAGAFALISNESMTRPQAFRDVARSVVNSDTLTDFLSSYRKRYPETAGSARPVRSAGDQSSVNQPLPGRG